MRIKILSIFRRRNKILHYLLSLAENLTDEDAEYLARELRDVLKEVWKR